MACDGIRLVDTAAKASAGGAGFWARLVGGSARCGGNPSDARFFWVRCPSVDGTQTGYRW